MRRCDLVNVVEAQIETLSIFGSKFNAKALYEPVTVQNPSKEQHYTYTLYKVEELACYAVSAHYLSLKEEGGYTSILGIFQTHAHATLFMIEVISQAQLELLNGLPEDKIIPREVVLNADMIENLEHYIGIAGTLQAYLIKEIMYYNTDGPYRPSYMRVYTTLQTDTYLVIDSRPAWHGLRYINRVIGATISENVAYQLANFWSSNPPTLTIADAVDDSIDG